MFNRFLLFVAALCLTVAPGFAQNPPVANTCYSVINGVGVYQPCVASLSTLKVQDAPGNPSTGYIFTAGTSAGSSANPFQVLCGGAQCINVSPAGNLFATGNLGAGNAFWFYLSNLLMQAVAATGDTGNAYAFTDNTGTALKQIQSSSLWVGSTLGGTKVAGLNTNGRAQITLSTPGSSAATCAAGEIWADAGFVYVCTATNTIKRAALVAF